MLCSREEFSFRNVYVSMLVGTKQVYTQKWFKKYGLETLFEDNIVKVREKRQLFKICKRISHSLFTCFQQLFCFCFFFILVTKHSLQYGFGFRISSKMSFTSAGLKTWRPASTNVTIDNSWFSLPGKPSLVIGICILMQWSINRSPIWWIWPIQKQLLNLFCIHRQQ